MGVKKTIFTEPYIQKLIKRFQAGDEEAFVDLWSRIYPYVYHLMRLDVDEATAGDLTSEVCIKLYDRGLHQYQPRNRVSFISWVHKLAQGVKIDELRRRRPITFSELKTTEPKGNEEYSSSLVERISREDKTPLEILIEQEEEAIRNKALKLLPKLLKTLSPEEQYVLYVSIYDERTYKEIAQMLTGATRQADRYRKMRDRALKKLGRLLTQYGIKSST